MEREKTAGRLLRGFVRVGADKAFENNRMHVALRRKWEERLRENALIEPGGFKLTVAGWSLALQGGPRALLREWHPEMDALPVKGGSSLETRQYQSCALISTANLLQDVGLAVFDRDENERPVVRLTPLGLDVQASLRR